MGRRETKKAVWRVSEVGSFLQKARKHSVFQRPRLAPETVVSVGNGGGKGTGIQRSLRRDAGHRGLLRSPARVRFAPSASDSFRQPFSFALRMRFSIATYSFPQQLLIHRPRHVGQDTRPIHNGPLSRLSTTASRAVRKIVPDHLRHCFLTPPNSLVSRPFQFFDHTVNLSTHECAVKRSVGLTARNRQSWRRP